jgi:hypothetical protein
MGITEEKRTLLPVTQCHCSALGLVDDKMLPCFASPTRDHGVVWRPEAFTHLAAHVGGPNWGNEIDIEAVDELALQVFGRNGEGRVDQPTMMRLLQNQVGILKQWNVTVSKWQAKKETLWKQGSKLRPTITLSLSRSLTHA